MSVSIDRLKKIPRRTRRLLTRLARIPWRFSPLNLGRKYHPLNDESTYRLTKSQVKEFKEWRAGIFEKADRQLVASIESAQGDK